jgi:hypothetical protein
LIGFLERGGQHRFMAFVLGTVLATTSRPEGAQVLILHLVMRKRTLLVATRPSSGMPASPENRILRLRFRQSPLKRTPASLSRRLPGLLFRQAGR